MIFSPGKPVSQGILSSRYRGHPVVKLFWSNSHVLGLVRAYYIFGSSGNRFGSTSVYAASDNAKHSSFPVTNRCINSELACATYGKRVFQIKYQTHCGVEEIEKPYGLLLQNEKQMQRSITKG